MNSAKLWFAGAIPVPRRIVQCVSNYYYINLPKELNTVWEVYSANGVRFDVVVKLPDVIGEEFGYDRIVMGRKKVVKKGDRYIIFLSKLYSAVWDTLCKYKARVDIVLVPRIEPSTTP